MNEAAAASVSPLVSVDSPGRTRSDMLKAWRRSILRTLGHEEWIRFGVRDRIIRFFDDPETSSDEEFVVPFFGAVYSGNFANFLDWSVFYYGAYAMEELRLFDDFLSTMDGPVVLDVGANIGHHTLFAAMRAREVFAFEPLAAVSKDLERKVHENRLSNVVLLGFGLGDKNEIAAFVNPNTHNVGSGSFVRPGLEGERLRLPIRIGDEALAENGIHDVHFVKIDVEGMEPFVLRGLGMTLTRCRPLVFFEWTQERIDHLRNASPASLFPEGYALYQFISDTPVLLFFRRRGYRLSRLSKSDAWSDGNILAVPQEYIEEIRRTKPSSNAAKKLLG
jgi:FkbM family methyltransferase